MTDLTCDNCGVPVSETPEEDGFHPVQEAVDTGGGTACEACATGDYGLTGDEVARAEEVLEEHGDDELAGLLAESMHAEELRRWMSSMGLTRSRGARKLESARQAVAQDPQLVAAYVDGVHGLVENAVHSAMCDCGYEEHFADEDAAVEAASEHKSDNPQHFPKAWAQDGRRLYG